MSAKTMMCRIFFDNDAQKYARLCIERLRKERVESQGAPIEIQNPDPVEIARYTQGMSWNVHNAIGCKANLFQKRKLPKNAKDRVPIANEVPCQVNFLQVREF